MTYTRQDGVSVRGAAVTEPMAGRAAGHLGATRFDVADLAVEHQPNRSVTLTYRLTVGRKGHADERRAHKAAVSHPRLTCDELWPGFETLTPSRTREWEGPWAWVGGRGGD